jgi:hypothetical protein
MNPNIACRRRNRARFDSLITTPDILVAENLDTPLSANFEFGSCFGARTLAQIAGMLQSNL